jgi:methylenetetrahydrofolate dehydrogenase (NADP+)/methenyltetrahydrofolate cyclohydrolase
MRLIMLILEGKQAAEKEKARIREEIAGLDFTASLAVVLAGEYPPSVSYVASKEKACAQVGIKSRVIRLPENVSQDELLDIIRGLNSDPEINGILVQIPLPGHIDEDFVLEAINPEKDVDGLHPYNIGRLFTGNPVFEPCTPRGIVKILDYYGISIEGKRAVIIGRSNIVGKPAAAMLLKRNATVTICHSKTKEIGKITKEADIIIAAVGIPGFLKADMVSEKSVIIDVGITRIDDPSRPGGYRLAGDADYQGLSGKVYAITPVPGGVGMMTVPMLLDNTVRAAVRQRDKF